jgi:ATP-dependent Lhr-like helicase
MKGREDQMQMILHTLWGGSVNRPFAMALQAAWEEQFGEEVEIFQDDDCLLVRAPRVLKAGDLFDLVDPNHVESLLRRRLEATGYFGARFRGNASTALLLPRAGWNHRTPLWMNRQRAKRLMSSVARYGDFPILLETWRTCLVDEFELDALKKQLRRIREGELPLTEVHTETPSPMAAGLMWQHTNFFMYQDDTPEVAGSSLRQDLLQELVFSAHLRPRLAVGLCEEFRRKVQRTAAGYSPAPGDDLHDWLVERLLVPAGEWEELKAAVSTEHGVEVAEVGASIGPRAVWLRLPGAEVECVVAVDRVPRMLQAMQCSLGDVHLGDLADAAASPPASVMVDLDTLLKGTSAPSEAAEEEFHATELMGEWARFYGPFEPVRLRQIFGLEKPRLASSLETLRESRALVVDQLTHGVEEVEICDAENLEILLRWLRRSGRPTFEALPAARLPLFLAHHQGLVARGAGAEDLAARLEQLFGFPAVAELWESEFLPARLEPYYPAWLDSAMQVSDLLWLGCGEKRLTFAFPEDLPLIREALTQGRERPEESEGEKEEAEKEEAGPSLEQFFPQGRGKYGLDELAREAELSMARVSAALWQFAWVGKVSNDTFLAMRQGLLNKFKPQESSARLRSASKGRRLGRRGFDRWKGARSSLGNWFALEPAEDPRDVLEQEELGKDRARLLLERYGLVCRELVAREGPALRWSKVFRALRLMELSGEVLAGHFFEGVRGLQFITHDAFRNLRESLPEDAIYWFCAADPASLCGVDIEGLKGELPPRLGSTHLVYHGVRLVLVSKRRGKELDPRVGAEHPHLAEYFGVLKMLLAREVQPLSNLEVETIAGVPALKSPYVDKMGEVFRVTRETRSVRLWKRY